MAIIRDDISRQWNDISQYNEKSVSDYSEADNKKRSLASSDFAKQQASTTCHCCKEIGHKISSCSRYLSLSVADKKDFIKKHSMCFNCMSIGHLTNGCTSLSRCRVCKSKHHTSIHMEISNSHLSNEKKERIGHI